MTRTLGLFVAMILLASGLAFGHGKQEGPKGGPEVRAPRETETPQPRPTTAPK